MKIMRNIAEMFHFTARKNPHEIFLVYNEKKLTWYEIYTQAVMLGDRLKKAGITRGDRVAIYTDHSPAQVIGIFGIAMADAVFTIVHPLLKENQIKHQVNDCSAKAIVTIEKKCDSLHSIFKSRQIHIETIPETALLIDVDSSPSSAEMIPPSTKNVPTDVACIMYTSGSTGLPKGVVVPHRTLLDGVRIVSDYLKITSNDALLSILPLSFDYGLNQLLSAVYTGARIVLLKFTLPRDLIETLVREKITGMAVVPSMWHHLFNPKLFDAKKKPHFEYLRYITSGGGKHSQGLLESMVSFFPSTEIIIMYGLTESFRSTYLPFSELFNRIGSIGKAVPEVEILVLNEKQELCKPGERGELIHRGAFVNYGYLNAPELTKNKFIHLHTGGPGCLDEIAVRSGDIVSMDEEGFIYFHGRADMQIKCSGYRISPNEVEEAVLSFSDIQQAAAFGVEDFQLGESVNLAYTTYSGKPMEEKKLVQHLNRALPSYAIPRHINFYPKIPITLTGKIDYSILQKDASKNKKNGLG